MSEITERMLTTVDNPFDPFEQFDQWFALDCAKNYYTCSYIDRVVQLMNPKRSTLNATKKEYDEAIDEIVILNPELYRVVTRTVKAEDVDLIQ